MIDSIQELLLRRASLTTSLFAPNSRYYGLQTETLESPSRGTIVYLSRRFVPPPDSYALRTCHVIVEGDRIDNLAAKYLGDPEVYWQLCDANRAMDPREVTATIGRTIRITLPEGVGTGASNG